mmetsp:Transcript_68898/g.128624  ORF Transcript_68898/g.128624 Transcript_68898/m.128624 type:complete len:205 (+) Transcript_68898:1750-2364(+)
MREVEQGRVDEAHLPELVSSVATDSLILSACKVNQGHSAGATVCACQAVIVLRLFMPESEDRMAPGGTCIHGCRSNRSHLVPIGHQLQGFRCRGNDRRGQVLNAHAVPRMNMHSARSLHTHWQQQVLDLLVVHFIVLTCVVSVGSDCTLTLLMCPEHLAQEARKQTSSIRYVALAALRRTIPQHGIRLARSGMSIRKYAYVVSP